MADLYIKNAVVTTETETFSGGVVVDGGKIVDFVKHNMTIEAKEVMDLGGKYLLPGLVDGHVHFNEDAAQLRGNCLAPLAVDVEQTHLDTPGGQHAGGGFTQPGGSARNDG